MDRERERDTEGETERERERERGTLRGIERERERDTEGEREIERGRERIESCRDGVGAWLGGSRAVEELRRGGRWRSSRGVGRVGEDGADGVENPLTSY